MAGRFSVEAVFRAIDRVTAPVTKMQNRVGKFTRSMQRNFTKLNRITRKMGDGLKKGVAIGTAALVGLGAAMGNVIGIGADFGRVIGSAASKFKDEFGNSIKRGTEDFKALSKEARRVGATTEFTATQAAQGLLFMAKAGKSAKFSILALGDIVDFATASEIDLAEAADIVSDSVGAFGLDSKDPIKALESYRRVMDVMSTAANSSNFSVSELFESVKDGAPIAIKAGQSIETFAAIAATLANAGLKGSKVGVASKNIALALSGVGNKAAKTFDKLGIKLTKPNGKLRDIADVFEDLNDAIKDMDQDKMLGVVNAIFGKISLASAVNLLGEGSKTVRKFRTDFEAAGGSSKRTAAFIRNDVKGSIDQLNSAIDGVKISIFSMNEGPLKEAIDKMTAWVTANEKLIATNIGEFFLSIITNMESIVKWMKRVAIGVASFVAFATAVKTATLAVTAFNLVMAINPIGLMVIGVAALIAGFTALIVWIDDIAAAFDGLHPIIRLVLAPLELIIKAIQGIKSIGATLVGKLGSALFDIFGNDPANDDTPTQQDETFDNVIQQPGATGPQIITPQERVARSVEEQRTTSTAEVTIKDETGRAEVTHGKLNSIVQLQQSGAL